MCTDLLQCIRYGSKWNQLIQVVELSTRLLKVIDLGVKMPATVIRAMAMQLRNGVLLVACGFIFGFAGSASAELFVYEGPRGETLVSNMEIDRPGYHLRHKNSSVENVGHKAAGRAGPRYGSATIISAFGSKGSAGNSKRKWANSTEYDGYIKAAARKHGVDPALVKAVIQVESNFNPSAVSSAGARGLMQLMPGTAARYDLGIHDLFVPRQNIDAGVKHLAYLKTLFPNNTDYVLAAYNAGENNVVRYNGIPPFPETVDYVQKVKSSKQLFQRAFL